MHSRQYVQAARVISECHKDSALTTEEKCILRDLPDDSHPDAIACRLRLTLLCRDCGFEPDWHPDGITKTTEDLGRYLTLRLFVSTACGLSAKEERRIWSHYRSHYSMSQTKSIREGDGHNTPHYTIKDIYRNYRRMSRNDPDYFIRKWFNLYYVPPLKYCRPEAKMIAGSSALHLMETLWDDAAAGMFSSGFGFAFLYDVLLGRRKIKLSKKSVNLEGSTDLRETRHRLIKEYLEKNDIDIASASSKSSNKTSAPLVWENPEVSLTPELEEAIATVDAGEKDVSKGAASFVKLITNAILLKFLLKSRNTFYHPNAICACILLLLAQAVLDDMPVAEILKKRHKTNPTEQTDSQQKDAFSWLPSFPFLRHETALLHDGVSVSRSDLRVFFRHVSELGLAICKRLDLTERHKQPNNTSKPLAGPTETEEQPRDCTPRPCDHTCKDRTLECVPPVEPAQWRGISEDDVCAFAVSPLKNVWKKGDDVPRVDEVRLHSDASDIMAKLPVDLRCCSEAQSMSAQRMLDRIDRDLQDSSSILKSKKVPRLTFLHG